VVKARRKKFSNYSATLRKEIMAYTKEARARGVSLDRIARKYKVLVGTLYGWLYKDRHKDIDVTQDNRLTAASKRAALFMRYKILTHLFFSLSVILILIIIYLSKTIICA